MTVSPADYDTGPMNSLLTNSVRSGEEKSLLVKVTGISVSISFYTSFTRARFDSERHEISARLHEVIQLELAQFGSVEFRVYTRYTQYLARSMCLELRPFVIT